MRRAPVITLNPEQRTVLESQARSRSFPLRVVERARIVLLAACGQQDKEIAARMVTTPKKVSRWRARASDILEKVKRARRTLNTRRSV